MSTVLRTLSGFALAALAGAAAASDPDPWALCRPDPTPAHTPASPAGDLSIHLIADEARVDRAGMSVFRGDAVLSRDGRSLFADELRFHEVRGYAEAEGNVVLDDGELRMESHQGHLYLESQEGAFESAVYRYRPMHARGEASEVLRLGPGQMRFTDATYTTCEPDRDDWILRARRVDLDQETGRGSARNVSLRFKRVPLFYTPYITFPIDDRRKSGFLYPEFGSSDESGFDLAVPYYLNIAPHRDATITPRFLGDRGLLAGGEFRYLNPRSHGQVNLEYLDDRVYGEERGALSFTHRGNPFERTTVDVSVNTVSDAEYLSDLGGTLDLSSTTHLENRADLRYRGENWSLLTRLQGYQTVDPAIPSESRPYQRLPQVLLRTDPTTMPGGLETDLRAEWVAFERSDTLTGQRLDLMPAVRLPMRRAYGFLEPQIKYRYTGYQLSDTEPGQDTTPDRAVPIVSLDSGLFFDRPMGGERMQTLEPRLYYLYVPHRDQDELPLFDTGRVDFSFDQLFRDTRFTGADRVGDANQLTLALTSRVINMQSGEERFRVSGGQILYFDDRRVTLAPGADPDTRGSSSLVAEAALRMARHWYTSTAVQWDPHREQTELATAQLQYRGPGRRIANLGYRLREDPLRPDRDLEQVDVSAAWPLSTRWDAVGRYNYSLRDNRDVEILAGLEYESCCWRARVVARRYLTTSEDREYNNAIHFQLILKGLAGLGTNLGDLLGESIRGFESHD
ncbi:organic solvent tolerance protein [Thioalkalivibrio denitrificans]|uniref:LPS-assembly protein LptD n=1 Tax=Thioalkalivibrio denitrificans TaxID=108003 RepID=A0A1V3NIF3_9GAMM|nr:LPS assembly protein LptD [Thioalkalivibrio denitrificans]OOG24764.1 organic solvent tolerance protein [Thioalkalivibrio denitrificans]